MRRDDRSDFGGSAGDLTVLLRAWRRGDEEAFEQLVPRVYDSLRGVARRYLNRERPGHTLQSTALVHEAFLRLREAGSIDWKSREHFAAIAARIMRRILVDHARERDALKRGGNLQRITLEVSIPSPSRNPDLLALDFALEKLDGLDARQARIVELRYFGGLTVQETARVMELSSATVKREWATAKAWLWSELQGETASEE